MRRQRAQLLVVALGLLALAVYEGVHDAMGHAWPGFSRSIAFLGIFYVPLWTAAAVGLLLNARWGWLMGVVATLFAMVHGFGINLGGSKQGLPFSLTAIVLGVLVVSVKPWTLVGGKRREEEPLVAPARHAA